MRKMIFIIICNSIQKLNDTTVDDNYKQKTMDGY